MKIPPPKKTFHSDAPDFPKHGIWDDDIVMDCWVWTSQVKAVGFPIMVAKELMTKRTDSKESSFCCMTNTLKMIG